jgi:small conductance mechanosensitive channel
VWDTIVDFANDFWSENSTAIVSTVLVLIGAFILTAIARHGVKQWERKIDRELGTSEDASERERGQRLATISDVLRVFISIVVIAVVVLTIMGVWGIPMTPLIAIGSTIGIAVGLGAQDVVRDVIAGFLILVEDQYSIGDTVTVAGVSGTVESIMLRTTVLRDLDGNRHFVPNGQIKVASNLTSEFSRLVLDIPVSYETDVDPAMEVIMDEATTFAYSPQWRDRFLEPPEMLGVNKLGDSAVDIRILMTLTSESRWEVKREFLRRIKIRFDRDGIEIPYQHVTLVGRPGESVGEVLGDGETTRDQLD